MAQRTHVWHRILIVDDHPAIQEAVKMKLEDIEDLYFDTADNIVEAYNKILNDIPELVILDGEMPGGDGGELVQILKQDIRYNNIKILGYTGSQCEAQQFELLKVDKIIIKSSKEDDLVNFQNTVAKLLEN